MCAYIVYRRDDCSCLWHVDIFGVDHRRCQEANLPEMWKCSVVRVRGFVPLFSLWRILLARGDRGITTRCCGPARIAVECFLWFEWLSRALRCRPQNG